MATANTNFDVRVLQLKSGDWTVNQTAKYMKDTQALYQVCRARADATERYANTAGELQKMHQAQVLPIIDVQVESLYCHLESLLIFSFIG